MIPMGVGRARGRGQQHHQQSNTAAQVAASRPGMNAQSRPFQSSLEVVNSVPVSYTQPFMVPYAAPYMYTAQYSYAPAYAPYNLYYQPTVTYFQPVQPVTYPFYAKTSAPAPAPTNKFLRGTTPVSETGIFPSNLKGYGYATAAATVAEVDESSAQQKLLDIGLSVDGFHDAILEHLRTKNECRVSWLNRMLAKCSTAEDYQKAKAIFMLFHARVIETTPETGTLLIKAACRAEAAEDALQMLQDIDKVRIWPTLGGVHYLMINFSLKKNTQAVIDTYEVTKVRRLKPVQRTFHILIRECVDNNLVDEAMRFAQECASHEIVPNRVTYNILMNGCRKFGKADDILALREEMNKNNVEINETTVKFTVLAHLMKSNVDAAVTEFQAHTFELQKFCDKFLEGIVEDSMEVQLPLVSTLFESLQARGVKLPEPVIARWNELKSGTVTTSTTSSKSASEEVEEAGEASVETKA